jgi:hypothetical protein
VIRSDLSAVRRSNHDHLLAWVGTDGIETFGLCHGPARSIELSHGAAVEQTSWLQELVDFRE